MRSLLAGVEPRLRTLRYGFLVVPGGCALAFLGLAYALVRIDRSSGADGLGVGVANDPEAARIVLSTIAASLITVAGVTFSITMVTLQLVSQQFSPRALRGFLGDRLNQAVAGVFVGTFIYCLIVLRTVTAGGGGGGQAFVPSLSVAVAIGLAVVALLLLLVFIDHIARSIQVSSVAGSIARATLARVRAPLYPDPYGRGVDEDPRAVVRGWREGGAPRLVRTRRAGYVRSVTIDDIPRHVGSPGLRIDIRVAPGDFLVEDGVLAAYWPGEDDGDLPQALRLAVVVADERDLRQDPGYGIRQLADIATRAISPGVNDPTTALTCIRHLRAVMEPLARTRFPSCVRRYDDVGVIVTTAQMPFETYVETAFIQVGRYATDVRVAGALLETIGCVMGAAEEAGARDRVAVLASAADRIGRAARGEPDPADLATVDGLLKELRRRAHGAAAAPGDGRA